MLWNCSQCTNDYRQFHPHAWCCLQFLSKVFISLPSCLTLWPAETATFSFDQIFSLFATTKSGPLIWIGSLIWITKPPNNLLFKNILLSSLIIYYSNMTALRCVAKMKKQKFQLKGATHKKMFYGINCRKRINHKHFNIHDDDWYQSTINVQFFVTTTLADKILREEGFSKCSWSSWSTIVRCQELFLIISSIW